MKSGDLKRQVIVLVSLASFAGLAQGQAPLAPGVSLPPYPARTNPLDKITPVTDAKLAAPPAEDWLSWRRTLDDVGFSPLKQITKSNAATGDLLWQYSRDLGKDYAPSVKRAISLYGDKVFLPTSDVH